MSPAAGNEMYEPSAPPYSTGKLSEIIQSLTLITMSK